MEHLCEAIKSHDTLSVVYDKADRKWEIWKQEGQYGQYIGGIEYCPLCGEKLEGQ